MLAIFFFNDTATTEIYALSLHDALPICPRTVAGGARRAGARLGAAGECVLGNARRIGRARRSEEHTSELQSQSNLVCRLQLEKKSIYRTLLCCTSSTRFTVSPGSNT